MGVDRAPAARRLRIGLSLEASVRGTKGSTAPALRMTAGRPLRTADGYRMTCRKSIVLPRPAAYCAFAAEAGGSNEGEDIVYSLPEGDFLMRNAVVLAVATAVGLAGCNTSQPEPKPTSQTITSAGTVALYPPGSSIGATFTPSSCYVPKMPSGNFRYSGGPGDRLETAIVIDSATNEVNGGDGEYAYVRQYLSGWKVCGQALIRSDTGLYDRIDLQDGSGTRRQIHFDITSWFGKMPY